MQVNNLKQIHQLGQSIWLDFFDRKIMRSGTLQKLIEEDDLTGMTSNPAIFEKAISGSADYDEDIEQLAHDHASNEDIFFGLAVKDIRQAASLFEPVFGRGKIKGADGYVSLEVSPRLAHDANATIDQARALWKQVDRPNVMIKIPGTAEGVTAIRQCISDGININVTLLFGLNRYKEVIEAYLGGLEDRLQAGHSINGIASVASFFLSRIDVLVDPLLEAKGMGQNKGQAAIACAKEAYKIYQERFSDDRFAQLKDKGARPQRLLWASTSPKNPAFKDTMYVEALIGRETINTIPIETLNAFRDHGHAALTLETNLPEASRLLNQLDQNGIDLEAIAKELEEDGIEKFMQSFKQLLESVESKRLEQAR